MKIKRKIYEKLIEWKNSSNGKKALLIEGARRIGKSTIAEELGKNEYKSYIMIDFNKASKKILESFDDLGNLDVFFQTLSLEYNKRLYKRESLIIFDEIQKFPKAREAIKYLVADGRYDFIETGSLISIRENVEDITIPSEERKLKMYPVDFEEFAMYLGEELLLEYIKKCYEEKVPLERKMHEKAMHLFKEYMLVGGMPQAVVAFAENEIMDQQLYKLIMNDKLSLNEGMIYENAISQIIASKGRKLYFYTRYSEEKHRNDIEIDFLLSNESKMNFKVFPVEVKSSKNYTAPSLIRFRESFSKRIDLSYIVHPKNFIIDNEIIKMPPYMFSVVT